MSKFEKVKKYYERGLWNETMVENAVKKGWITEEQAIEILTEDEDTEVVNDADND